MNPTSENTTIHNTFTAVVFVSLLLLVQGQTEAGDFLLTPPSGKLHYQRDNTGQVKPVVFPALAIPSSWSWAQDLSLYEFQSLPVTIGIPILLVISDDPGAFPPDIPGTPVNNWEIY